MIPNILRKLLTSKPTPQILMAKQSEPISLQKLATPEIRAAAEKIRAVSAEINDYCDRTQEIFNFRVNLDNQTTRAFNEVRTNPSIAALERLLALRSKLAAFDMGNVRTFTREEYYGQVTPQKHPKLREDIAEFLGAVLVAVRAELADSQAADAKIAAELGVEKVSSTRTDSAKNLEKFAMAGNFAAACHLGDLILDGESAAMSGNIPIHVG
ncbi:MAG TPA: hypothetical protein PLS03_06820 [Terrimicrobiaceae bacterium]|nr:hypothetical protein [Terrimicrobiaceae bacterium]